MPLALHDFLGRTTPVSPGPPPAVVTVASTYVWNISPWKPKAIIATSIEDGTARILRVETPSPAQFETQRQAWIWEVAHLWPGSGGTFPDTGAAEAAAFEILQKLWGGIAPPVLHWNNLKSTDRWNSPHMGTWDNPRP